MKRRNGPVKKRCFFKKAALTVVKEASRIMGIQGVIRVGLFKRISILLLALILATGCQPESRISSGDDVMAISERMDFGARPTDQGSEGKLNVHLDVRSFDSEDEALKQAQDLLVQSNLDSNQTTIVSSDNFKFLQQVGEDSTFNNGRNFLVLNDALTRFTKQPVDYIKRGYHDDKIGFAIAIYTTAVETVIWLHVAPMSTLAASANIAFTIGTAIYFKLNKDKWTQITDKMKTPMRRFFNDMDTNSVRKKMLYDFVANLGLASALSLVRIPMISMDQIMLEGVALGMFKIPLLMSIVGTASSFTWSEHQGAIDKNTYPISKFVFRRVGEVRSILLVTFASTAALLNPATFGIAPWITLSVTGAAGLVLYLKSKDLNEWIENSPIFRKLENVVRMNTSPVGGVLMCRQLFN